MESIVLKDDKLKMMFQPTINDKIDGSRLFQLVSQADRRFGLISGTQIGITFRVDGLTENEWLTMVVSFWINYTANLMKEEKKSNALSVNNGSLYLHMYLAYSLDLAACARQRTERQDTDQDLEHPERLTFSELDRSQLTEKKLWPSMKEGEITGSQFAEYLLSAAL